MKSSVKLLVLLFMTSFACACSKGTSGSSPFSSAFSSAFSSSGDIKSSDAPSSSEPIISSNPIFSSSEIDELESKERTCDIHHFETSVRRKATIIQRGIERHTCPNCEGFYESYYYDLEEYDFSDTTYMYDGNEREITISGLIPYGCSVKYKDNKLTEIGEITATAEVYDPEDHLIDTKTAKLSIVENIGLPNIKITTVDGEDPEWRTQSDGTKLYKEMTVTVDNCDSKYQKEDLSGQMKVRGNSTNQESVAKRAFRLKFSSKVNLLGLNEGAKEKNWVLLADFFDQSRLRNQSAFIMGDSLFNHTPGLYSSDGKHVNLFMNGEDRGVYLLAEQQQAKTSRMPVNEPNEYTGTDVGYIVEIDGLVAQKGHISSQTGLGTVEGDPCFNADSGGQKVNGVSISSKGYVIKTDTYSDEQRQFIRKYINNCTKAFANVCNGNLKVVDSNAEIVDSPYSTMYESLNAFLDIDSFFRMYVLQEFAKDYDVGWGSFYMYVDFSSSAKVKRLTMSAPWDFDLGLGDKRSGQSDKDIPSSGISSTKDDFLNKKEYINGMTTFNPMLYMLSQTDFFKDMFKKYYSVFNGSGIVEKMLSNIAYERIAFATEFNNNHTKYGKGASGATLMQTRQYNSHSDAVDYLVKWLGERKAYLDAKYL